MSNGISPEIASFFKDPDASSAVVLAAQHVAAPVVKGATLTEDETRMGGGIRVVYFILDRSPSMDPVAALLRKGFNADFVPAVKEAREDDISALRLGGLSFSDDITPIWQVQGGNSLHKLDELPQLTTSEFDPERGWGTALHKAILDGTAIAMRYAGELQRDTGIDVDVDIVILSDGANNYPPRATDDVRRVITGRDKSRVRYVLFYFETEHGLKVKPERPGELSELQDYAINQLGIDAEQVQAFARKDGETDDEMRHRFRALMNVMSRVSAARNTSAVVATAMVLPAAAAVDDDEEIV